MEKKIGASEVPLLFTQEGFVRLYKEKAGLISSEDVDNEAIRLGKALERSVLDCAGLEYSEFQPEFSTGEPLRLVVHPDAICPDGWIVECKTTGLAGPTDWPSGDELPERVTYQVQAQLLASGAPGCMVVALIGGRGLHKYQVLPDELIQNLIQKKILELWACVDGQTPPPSVDDSTSPEPVRSSPSPGRHIVIESPDAEETVQAYLEVKQKINELTKEQDRLRTALEDVMQDAESAVCGGYLIKRAVVKQTRLDTKQVVAQPSWFRTVQFVRFDVKERSNASATPG